MATVMDIVMDMAKVSPAKNNYRGWIKRLISIILSGLLILVLWPLILILALAVVIDSKGPAFFIQERIGLHGHKFKMFKLRSMKDKSEFEGSGVYSGKDDARLTRVGRLLRSSSLDELPQLFNIFIGDMSFIGPRAPLTYHPWPYEQYTEEQRRMFEVRPGLTGWAQINGRSAVPWDKRIKLNIWYIDHLSFIVDLRIAWKTIPYTLRNEDNEHNNVTV